MLLIKLFNYIRGYIIIKVDGHFIERFFNICSRRRIYLWDIKKVNSHSASLKISIPGYKSVRPVVRKSNCRVKIDAKKGLPFIIRRYKKRKMFFIGCLLFFGLITYMSSFVWLIEISETKTIEKQRIISQLEELGLKVGRLKMRLKTDEIENNMMLNIGEISWINIDIKGTKARISITEKRLPPKIVERDKPCNLIAAKDGIIKQMIIKDGETIVNEGDTVEKGQLLVSGIIDSKTEEVRYIHSVGSIKARTWYEETVNTKLSKEVRIKTGNKKTRYKLDILNKKINLFLNKGISYENYDKIINERRFHIGNDYIFPIAIEKNIYEEVKLENINLELEAAIIEAEKQLTDQIKRNFSDEVEIIKIDTKHGTLNEEGINVTVIMECLEEIGVQDEIIKY